MNKTNPSLHSYYLKLIVFILITFANFWWILILKENFLYGLLLILITFILFFASFNVFSGLKLSVIMGVLFVILSTLLIKNHFDYTLKTLSPTDEKIQTQRHGVYADGLGILFTNKLSQNFYKNWSMSLGKYLRNISYSVDPNLYFFSSHPREKSGIDEFEKYSPFLLPIFIIGVLIHALSFGKIKALTAYLLASIIITGFISPYFKLGPILLFPYISIVIALGAASVIKKNYVKKAL